MSQNTGIYSKEAATLKLDNNKNKYIEYILVCNCGEFHEFYIDYNNEYNIVFPCVKIKLSELNSNKNLRKKCNNCSKNIEIKKDYCEINKEKTLFFCESCNNTSQKEKKLKKIADILSIENNDEKARKEMNNKF